MIPTLHLLSGMSLCLSLLGCAEDSVAKWDPVPVPVPVPDLATAQDLATQPDLGPAPDLAPMVYRSCLETLQQGGQRADGRYLIDPDGAGGAPVPGLLRYDRGWWRLDAVCNAADHQYIRGQGIIHRLE